MAVVTERLKAGEGYFLLLTEPCVHKGKLLGKPRQSNCFPNEGNEKQRAVIVTDKSVIATEVKELTTKDCIAITVRIGGKEVLIISFYCDINKKIP